MASFSTSLANQVGQAVHAGCNFTFVAFKSDGNKTPFSRSVSDAIVVMNLPRNAQIITAWLGGMVQDGNAGFSLGDPGSSTRYGTLSISATTLQAIPFSGLPQGFVFSVSDDQTSYPISLNLQNTTSTSGSLSVHVGMLWVKV